VIRDQLSRIERVLIVRQRAVDRAELEFGQMKQRAHDLEAAVAHAEVAWRAAVDRVPLSPISSAELAEAHGFAASRRQRLDASLRELAAADERAAAAWNTLAAAKTELHKIEHWREGALAAHAIEERRRDRRATDEVAARIVRSQ